MDAACRIKNFSVFSDHGKAQRIDFILRIHPLFPVSFAKRSII